MAIGTKLTDEYTRPKYEQIDFIITPRRWRNAVTNIQTDPVANINTDHLPMIVMIRTQLAKIKKDKETAPIHDNTDNHTKQEYNISFRQAYE